MCNLSIDKLVKVWYNDYSKREKELSGMRKQRVFENFGYVVLMGLIIAQCVIGKWYILGQCIYLACNVISVVRSFVLKRPKADKIKDFSCTAITIGLILMAIK